MGQLCICGCHFHHLQYNLRHFFQTLNYDFNTYLGSRSNQRPDLSSGGSPIKGDRTFPRSGILRFRKIREALTGENSPHHHDCHGQCFHCLRNAFVPLGSLASRILTQNYGTFPPNQKIPLFTCVCLFNNILSSYYHSVSV